MKYKKLLLFFFILILASFPFCSKGAQTLSQAEVEKLIQKIEILKQEVLNLKALILSMKSQQKISAKSYLAVNLLNGSVIINKNENQAYPIASITKLMNAVITLETVGSEQKITITEEMLEPFGSSPAIYKGLIIKSDDLLKASLTQSVNDASEALSYFIGKEKFLSIMNQKAKELGMANTIFYDVHGLNPDNKSSASDLAKLLRYIYNNHAGILTISRNNDFWLPDEKQKLVKFKNVNNLYALSDFIGGKTGYLVESKQTMASIFNINGKPVAIIVLYSDSFQNDVISIMKKIKN